MALILSVLFKQFMYIQFPIHDYDITLSIPSFPIFKSPGLLGGLYGTIVYCALVDIFKQWFFKQRTNGPKPCTQLYKVAGTRTVLW